MTSPSRIQKTRGKQSILRRKDGPRLRGSKLGGVTSASNPAQLSNGSADLDPAGPILLFTDGMVAAFNQKGEESVDAARRLRLSSLSKTKAEQQAINAS